MEEVDFETRTDQPDPYVDPAYPAIKEGAKFTPKRRSIQQYSTYVITDAHPDGDNRVKATEVVYVWCGGYYVRWNQIPFECELDRDDLIRSHCPSHQGKRVKEE